MTKRVTMATAIIVCALLATLAVSVAACGSATKTTTTAVPPTATTAASTATTSAAGTATTAAGSVTVPSLQMTPELQAYLTQMQTVFGSLSSLPDSSDPLSVTDVSKVTDAQIKAAEDALTQVKAALEQLKALKPPAELTAFQTALAAAVSSEIDIATKAIEALKSKDQAALDTAKADSAKLDAQMSTMIDQLLPLMMGGTATS